MKKLLLFAAVATMFASCSTDTTEDIAVLPDVVLRVSFSEDDSRVQLDENSRTVWNEGDLISVFNKTDGNECWRFDGKTGDSVGTISRVSGSAGGSAIGRIFAVYPYAESNAVSANSTITTEIPATQKYCADSYGIGNNIMVASSENGDLAFKNALGWIKIRLSGTETVKSLVLEGNDGETLAGAATVDTDSAVSIVADAAKSLTLDCGEGVALSSDPTAFYFAVVPQVFEKGITVTAHYSDGSTFEKSTDKAIAVERNHIVPMAKFDATVIPNNQIWYTSTDGEIVVPSKTDGFGANIISNTYSNGLGRIVFDKALECIGDYAFYMCTNLSKIIIPNQTTLIKNDAFQRCTSLTDITLPNSLISIEDNVFLNCVSIKEITIPEGVISLGSNIFLCDPNEHSELETVYLPSTLNEIGYSPFARCTNLKNLYGPCKLISDDGHCIVFDNTLIQYTCKATSTEYKIPDGVRKIENYSFYGAENLTSLTFPASVEVIGNAAFIKAYNIEKIYGPNVLPDNRSYVYDNTLWYVADKGISEYTTPDNIQFLAQGVFSDKQHLETIIVSDNVLSVEYYGYLFSGSQNLKTITISARMNNLGYDPFGSHGEESPYTELIKCKNLETIYLRAPIPPSIKCNNSELISSAFNNLTIYVPEETLDRYMASPSWIPYRKYLKGYNYGDLSEFYPDYYISSDYSADGTVLTLQRATVGKGIDIILMGDAFSDRQIAAGDYDTAMRQAADNLFTEEPYKSFRNMFNVYAVTAVSATEGYEHGYTAFSGYFGGGTLVGGNDAKVFEYAQKAIAAERMDDALIVVMMNSQSYAGTCYMYYPSSGDYGRGVSVAYFPLGTDNDMFAQLLHHEACGHGFAKLDDEYAYEYMGAVSAETVAQHNQLAPYGWYKNVDFTSDPTTVKWHTFLSDPRYANEGLGVFEGGATYWTGVWRSTENSIMRYNTGGFNAPSREAIYYRIHKLAYGESWNYDYEDFAAYDAVNRKASAGISFSTPIVPKDFVPLAPPVVVGKSWREAK